LKITKDETLIIRKGTTIIIDTAVDIVVNGTMLIEGTKEEPVQLLPEVDTIGWGRIYLKKPGSNNKIEHAKIVDGTLLSLDANLTYRDVHFINRQKLPINFNITRVERAKADLQNCSVQGSGTGEGFLLMHMEGAVIRNCTFHNTPDAIEITKLRNSRISHNLIVDVPDDAIDLNNCTHVLLDSNIIIHAHDRGFEIGSEIFGSSTDITVLRNLIVNCREGVTFKEGSSGTVINNTLYLNKTGVVSEELVAGRGGSRVKVKNTIIAESRWRDLAKDSLSVLEISYSLSDKGTLPGSHNLHANPQFKDPEQRNFTLQKDSPCIDAGDPVLTPDPDGTVSDIGAYFYPQKASVASNSDNSR
jgi:parallel beta-helix repeat protein